MNFCSFSTVTKKSALFFSWRSPHEYTSHALLSFCEWIFFTNATRTRYIIIIINSTHTHTTTFDRRTLTMGQMRIIGNKSYYRRNPPTGRGSVHSLHLGRKPDVPRPVEIHIWPATTTTTTPRDQPNTPKYDRNDNTIWQYSAAYGCVACRRISRGRTIFYDAAQRRSAEFGAYLDTRVDNNHVFVH